MKSFLFGLSLATLVAAQIQVNGVSMVPMSQGSSSSSSSGSSPSSTSSSGSDYASSSSYAASSYQMYSNGPSPTSQGYSAQGGYSAPPQYTPPPSESTPSYLDQMPYSSFMAGGCKQLNCGYGYYKDQSGYCQPESWVSRCITFAITFRLIAPQWESSQGCYETVIINQYDILIFCLFPFRTLLLLQTTILPQLCFRVCVHHHLHRGKP
jgi:hypothetical protein